MKNKIAYRLALYFAAALIIFAAIMASLFIAIFRNTSLERSTNELKWRASTIASSLSRFTEFNNGSYPNENDPRFIEYNTYLQYMNDIARGNVWVLNNSMEIIAQTQARNMPRSQRPKSSAEPAAQSAKTAPESAQSQSEAPSAAPASLASASPAQASPAPRRSPMPVPKRTPGLDENDAVFPAPDPADQPPAPDSLYSSRSLPQNAEAVITQALLGDTTVSTSFSNYMKKQTLTVATPIKTRTGEVIGAVLLHSPVNGLNETLYSGINILAISLAAALLISFLLAYAFSYMFTKPLNTMKNSALELAGRNYGAKTGITQKDEIGQLAETLDMLADRLREADEQSERLEKMRQDYVANISHELRTPITVIRGSLEALRDGVVSEPEQVAEFHAQMLDETVSLQRMVNSLLELSRLQNEDFAIEMLPLNLCDIVDDAVRSAERIAEKKGITLAADIPADAPITINGDYGRLRQMFLTVLDNALKFSQSGSSVEVSVNAGPPASVRVRDHACGISPEELPHIFERFYKSGAPENHGGTGLGLSIAQNAARRHGARIEVTSEPGAGSEFTFVFDGIDKRV